MAQAGLRIMGLLTAHELKVAELYYVFASRNKENQSFWQRIAGEEEGHARLVESLAKCIEEGSCCFSGGKLKEGVILAATQTVQREIDLVQGLQGDLRTDQALARAIGIEQTIVEAMFYDVVDDDSDKARAFKQTMAVSVQTHIKRLKKHLDEFHLKNH